MSETCKLLFVYGTLLRCDSGATGREQRARLGLEADWGGHARTAGLLYDLGRYPGLVVSAQPGAEVHGEIFELAAPEHSLCWLDAYEGIVPGQPTHSEYQRVLRPIVRADGDPASAWVYVYRNSVERAVLIPEGRWIDPV